MLRDSAAGTAGTDGTKRRLATSEHLVQRRYALKDSSTSTWAFRALAAILAPLLISRAVGLILRTRQGDKLAGALLGQGAGSQDAREIAQKYSQTASEVVIENAMRWREAGVPLKRAAREGKATWPALTKDIAELLTVGGTFVRVVSEFLQEREQIRRRS
jgi:hypothetical protein